MVLRDATTDEAPPPASGWTVRDGFTLPDSPWDLGARRWVCRGRVHDATTAGAALAVRARGVGLDLVVALEGSSRHRFLEDLEKLGPVAAPGAPVPRLSGAQVRLLELLGQGATTRAAAAELAVSTRTAHRLLADARERLGVATTAEAVVRGAEAVRDR